MNVFFTVATIQQLPEAVALGESLCRHHPEETFLIGLCDEPGHLPLGWACPFPILPITDLPVPTCEELSQRYTHDEFRAAIKPLFFRAFRQANPQANWIIYLDPTVFLFQPLAELETLFSKQSILLTPHLLYPLRDRAFPDEKYFQNLGLFHAGFIALRQTSEASRFLDWWTDRVPERAAVDFCEGTCADQLWLMLVPALFEGVEIIKLPGWHVGIWNLHERNAPVTFFNFNGIVNQEGYFENQTRIQISKHIGLQTWLKEYHQYRISRVPKTVQSIPPKLGKAPVRWSPERKPPLGWRKIILQYLRHAVHFIETVDLPRK